MHGAPCAPHAWRAPLLRLWKKVSLSRWSSQRLCAEKWLSSTCSSMLEKLGRGARAFAWGGGVQGVVRRRGRGGSTPGGSIGSVR